MPDSAPAVIPKWRQIPGAVWALGFVSLLMDISSEMIHALFPLYLVTVLGTSVLTVGFIEGIAEATAAITKVFSGVLSDWLGKRKLLAVEAEWKSNFYSGSSRFIFVVDGDQIREMRIPRH